MTGVGKSYGGVVALENVDFACERGTIHAVLGENGAGKSTLIKIMAGVVQPSSGDMFMDGEPVRFASPIAATYRGIACIFQELSLMPDLTVADNICITDPPKRWGMIDGRAQRRRAEELLARVGCSDINPTEQIKKLSLSRRQMVEIAKALGRAPKLLILDEATSALTVADVEEVYRVLRQLREEGLAILYRACRGLGCRRGQGASRRSAWRSCSASIPAPRSASPGPAPPGRASATRRSRVSWVRARRDRRAGARGGRGGLHRQADTPISKAAPR